MAKYDIEAALSDVQTFLAANLNTQIAAINTEKNDGITLKSVDSGAYHLQYPSDRAELNDPFVVYEEEDEPQVQGVGNQVATRYRVGISVVLADNKLDAQIVNRLFRYRRALLDLLSANWDQVVKNATKVTVSATSPTPPFKDMNTGFEGRTVGVVLAFTIEG